MGVQLLPQDKEFEKKVLMSRNKYSVKILSMFKLSEEDIKEYENTKDDNELAEICIKDCSLKGYKLISKKDEPDWKHNNNSSISLVWIIFNEQIQKEANRGMRKRNNRMVSG